MKGIWRNALFVLAMFVAGGVAGLLFGKGPASVPAPKLPAESWSLPVSPNAGLARTDAAWKRQSPWSAVVTPAVVVGPPPPSPVVPVGLVRKPRSYEVIFIRPDMADEELHVRPGQRLPGGGRLLGAHRMQISWIDGDGNRQSRRLLFDPPTNAMSSGPTPSGPMPSGAMPAAPMPQSVMPAATPRSAPVPGIPLPPGYAPPRQ